MDEASSQSGRTGSVDHSATEGPPVDEPHFAEIDVTMLYIEEARARSERAVATLRSAGAEAHLIEALERSQQELSLTGKRLRQGTFFAVPSAQTTL
jgi:hypothetical protein